MTTTVSVDQLKEISEALENAPDSQVLSLEELLDAEKNAPVYTLKGDEEFEWRVSPLKTKDNTVRAKCMKTGVYASWCRFAFGKPDFARQCKFYKFNFDQNLNDVRSKIIDDLKTAKVSGLVKLSDILDAESNGTRVELSDLVDTQFVWVRPSLATQDGVLRALCDNTGIYAHYNTMRDQLVLFQKTGMDVF